MTDIDPSALPCPTRTRWQPLRLGLVELFHYDSEEFWFHDGHLLLRGNNGTGKSKVLSLTLPFLFDAKLLPSRIEPDGDASKKMAWNLLLGKHDRRMGYAWLELGRIDSDGQPHYLTLGCGLLAVAARAQVDRWFFMLDRQRVGEDFWLVSPTRVVLTRDRLREALGDNGQLFEDATTYRRAVDERLFHLGPQRYEALMDTLIQLRQPQLSKKPDESNLSNALTEALPPISPDLLADVADALNQLEEDRRELQEYEALERAVGQFNQRYWRYAATQARRRARSLRQAQTGFDNASRELSDNRQALQDAQEAEAVAGQSYAQAEQTLRTQRARLEELQSDPTMADAKALDRADADAQRQQRDAQSAREESQRRQQRLEEEQRTTQQRAHRADEAQRALDQTRGQASAAAEAAGLVADYSHNPLALEHASTLAAQPLASAQQALHQAVRQRREQVAHLQQRCEETAQAAQARSWAQSVRDERAAEAEDAAARREEADAAVELQSQQLIDAWQAHLDSARQLQVPNADEVLQALAVWTGHRQGENPARSALHQAQLAASMRQAQHKTLLQAEQQSLKQEQAALEDEQTRLQAGEDGAPTPPAWRAADAREGRAGAPLWQLVEFAPSLTPAQQAGLEAALQASGLLDAWVTPDGKLLDAHGAPLLHDSHWQQRPARAHSLAAWLQPAQDSAPDPAPGSAAANPAAIPAPLLQALLEGVACGPQHDADAETWIGIDGRFRLGALAGAWHKPRAEFIGYAARAAARAQRLSEIGLRLGDIAKALAQLQTRFSQWLADQHQARDEWQSAPSDEALHNAHLQAGARAQEFEAARQRLQQADQTLHNAVEHWTRCHQALEQDAQDLALSPNLQALRAIDSALLAFGEQLHALAHAARACNEALTEHQHQLEREQQTQNDAEYAAEQAAERAQRAEDARVRLQTLRETVGAKVEELQQRISDTRLEVERAELASKSGETALRQAAEARAKAEQKVESAQMHLNERIAARQQAIAQWQGFAATGLLGIALPDAELPPQTAPWTIDPALALARRAEQALLQIKDDDEAWSRVQSHISQDYTELGRALSALNHRAQAETSDFGLIVSIVYQNRPERPDQLGARLAGEIAQRRELLTAGEREVLENYLQAEIASTIHKLLHDAEQQVLAINQELAKRPTSTGVRFRLQWETLPEGGDGGAPVGLKAARQRLLNTSTDLWSAEDRRVVGEMLQQRIASERSRADAEQGGSLHEQLARALDYRRWHRFRVQRWDGQWRPLSGPASSGERALGLTVPLFAAVSSYYSSQSGSSAQAPRLVLLDEVFAGIDDAARQHCWALIREFDLDFVVTSEREWACSAELPGVAIAQLQRLEGIDAVHVSRWIWDGQARRPQADPDRRFPP